MRLDGNGMEGSVHDLTMGSEMELLQCLWKLDHLREVQSRYLEQSIGISSRQRTVLRLIGRFPGISAGQVAAMLHLGASALTALLKPLQERGLVIRSAHPRDRRRHRLGLSASGMELDVPLEGSIEGAIRRTVRRAAGSSLEIAHKLLQELARNIEAGTLEDQQTDGFQSACLGVDQQVGTGLRSRRG